MLNTQYYNIITLLSEKYKFDKNEAINYLNTEIKNNSIIPITPINTFLSLIEFQCLKEKNNNIFENSIFENLPKLQSNNIGLIGEKFINTICNINNIKNEIDGIKTKKVGGGVGDGIIYNNTVEIKTSHKGRYRSFQHELGEKPWVSDYLIFVDISPEYIYLTIIKNFTITEYKNCVKCHPVFPTRSFCWRKKTGSFKLDTTEKLNEMSIVSGYTIKITKDTIFKDIGIFMNKHLFK